MSTLSEQAEPMAAGASKEARREAPVPVRAHSTTLVGALERAARGDSGPRLYDGRNDPIALPWREVLERAAAMAGVLLSKGLRRGDRVVLLVPTGADFVVGYFGTLMAAGVPVPTSLGIGPGGVETHVSHVGHVVRDAAARFVVSAPRGRAVVERLVETELRGVEHLRSEDIPATVGGQTVRFPSIDPDATALLQYTSGSTSLPKGVELSHRAVLANLYGMGERIGMGPADTGVSWLPLFHDMGLIGTLLTSLYWEYPLYMMRPESFLLHPRRWLDAIGRFRATLSVAPNFAYELSTLRVDDKHLADLRLDSWRCALNGAEPIDPGTVERFIDRFGAVGFRGESMLGVYGLAENALAVTFPEPSTPVELESVDRGCLEAENFAAPATEGSPAVSFVSVGSPIAGQRIGIADGAGGFTTERRVGEVLVGGPALMKGYFRNEAATAKVLRDGWLHTGDLGFIAEGRLFLTGRSKELIVKRGRNLYPHDIERIAEEVSGVGPSSAVAFGMRSEAAGTEELVLVVESARRRVPEDDGLAGAVQAELLSALGLSAERIVVVPRGALPRTTSGKLRRGACRERWGQPS